MWSRTKTDESQVPTQSFLYVRHNNNVDENQPLLSAVLSALHVLPHLIFIWKVGTLIPRSKDEEIEAQRG